MALWSGANFQNLMGKVFSGLESLHDLITVWLLAILLVVIFVAFLVMKKSYLSYLSPDSEIIEKTWTLIPMLVLMSIAFPSIHLLCLQDSFIQNPYMSVKVISNQWNWQSEAPDQSDHLLDFDPLDLLSSFECPLLVSVGITRILLTSTDVLHSLGFPSLGVKLDSAPGRLNATMMEVSSPGLFVGSCYELCGSGHSSMPIKALAVF